LLLDELKFLASIGPLGVPVWVALKRVFISSLFIYTNCFTGPPNAKLTCELRGAKRRRSESG